MLSNLISRASRPASTILRIQCTTATRNYSEKFDALKHKEAPIVDNEVILSDKEIKERERLSYLISLPKEKTLSPINGVPEEQIKERRVRIFIPPKNAMQSGTDNINTWRLEFDCRERWENPLIGWSSTADPLSNMNGVVQFNTKEEAIEHCEKQGWKWFITSEEKPKKPRVKNYGSIFSWDKRTRASTK